MIFVSDKAPNIFNWSKKTSRKILHILIGNLTLILPFYTHQIFPLFVAIPFIPITFFACPYSPIPNLRSKLVMLQDKTEIGHPLGLVFYSFSFSILTALFFHVPYVVAAGILPMAYGDSFAALVGERYGKRRFNIFSSWKSVEGSLSVFALSFLSVFLGLAFYSLFYTFSIVEVLVSSLSVALIALVVEAVSPKGTDNLFVPFACAAFMYLTRAL